MGARRAGQNIGDASKPSVVTFGSRRFATTDGPRWLSWSDESGSCFVHPVVVVVVLLEMVVVGSTLILRL
jgi:hypothetical protein